MAANDRRQQPGNQTPQGRILVIDDEIEIRESLEALLTSEGYEVELAQNARKASAGWISRAWDLVLLDLMMPDQSGMEVLRDCANATGIRRSS